MGAQYNFNYSVKQLRKIRSRGAGLVCLMTVLTIGYVTTKHRHNYVELVSSHASLMGTCFSGSPPSL